MRLPQSLETLLLGLGIDVGADEEADNVEEWDPGLLGEELLRKRERDGGGDPGHLHDWHESCLPGRVDRVDVARAVDDGHRGQVDAVLDWRNLGSVSYCGRATKSGGAGLRISC